MILIFSYLKNYFGGITQSTEFWPGQIKYFLKIFSYDKNHKTLNFRNKRRSQDT